MAAQRPLVLIFQEFATLSTTPATPDLNCMIVGPSYWIKDFPDDRADIALSTPYGTLNSASPYTPPVGGSDQQVLSDAPTNKLGAVLDASSVHLYVDQGRAEIVADGDTVNSLVMSHGTTAASSAVMSISVGSFLDADVAVGDYVIITDSTATHTLIMRVRSVVAAAITFTSEVPAAGWTADANTRWRVERSVSNQAIPDGFATVDPSTNVIHIKGGITVPVLGVEKVLNYGILYVAYRSLREDLADTFTLSSVNEILGQLGKIDARNPLAAHIFVALQNTAGPIQYFGITSDDLTGYTSCKSLISARKDVYAVVPCSTLPSVIAMFNAEFVNLADPDYAVANGVPQKFRVVIGSAGSLPLTKIVDDVSSTGATAVNGSAPSPIVQITLVGATFISSGVLPGDTLSITVDAAGVSRIGTYLVVDVLSETVCVVKTVFPSAEAGNVTAKVLVGATVTVRMAQIAAASATTAAGPALYLDLVDLNAAFVDSGVLPTDVIEFPVNPNGTDFTDATVKFTIASVVSNQRLRIVNNGRDTDLVENELPHGATRSAPVTAIPSTSTLSYRVTRALDKDGQVTALVAVAQSFNSRRTVICWPDKVDVAGLVDGSILRTDPAKPMPAASQDGTYLAAAVGGMTAGLPSHQGFTNLGIAGISKLYHSNTYFEDRQITGISNGGWLVFQQDTPTALPYVVHQLTTDVSTLEFGEFSMVKNFDFVSLFVSDLLNPFIGPWNINDETIGFIRASVTAGIENLKLRKRPKIGAPIISGTITSLGQSVVSADRIEAYVEIDFPKPLNTIGLHRVSV